MDRRCPSLMQHTGKEQNPGVSWEFFQRILEVLAGISKKTTSLHLRRRRNVPLSHHRIPGWRDGVDQLACKSPMKCFGKDEYAAIRESCHSTASILIHSCIQPQQS